MKKTTLLIAFLGIFCNGQFFEESDSNNQQENENVFQKSANHTNESEDQGLDGGGPGGPGEDPLPVDKWIYILSLTGIAVGYYFLDQKRKLT